MAFQLVGAEYSANCDGTEEEHDVADDESLQGDTCSLCNSSYEKDLQLAAELGKTLLERNKELENCLKQHQNVIEDQTQEIEYLTKQTAALREVNDSRLRIYEQLEVSIQELERTNQRLSVDNGSDKKHIKSLCLSIDSLETRCEELQRALEEAASQQDAKQKLQKQSAETVAGTNTTVSTATSTGTETDERILQNVTLPAKSKSVAAAASSDSDDVVRLLGQVQELRSLRSKEQLKMSQMEEQCASLLQEVLTLEEKLNLMQQKEEDMKSLQEEIMTLEEVRQGQLCRRCLRTVDTRGQDELSLVLDREEDDDMSVVNSVTSETHCSTVMLQIQNNLEDHEDNPYRILVEKYEALLEMQRHPANRHQPVASSNNCLSLQEELQLSGDFNSFHSKEVESDQEEPEQTDMYRKENANKERKPNGSGEKAFSTTPTDFSEAETSSSGFSDETSNKATQTEGLLPPGSFLCSIADGDDCRFSIYDDASPIESRFRKTPEYRQLFREIFAVLKRAAEAKDEGEQLPLLEDLTPILEAPKVPPVTPAKEEQPMNFSLEDTAPTKGEKKKSTDEKQTNEGVTTENISDTKPDKALKSARESTIQEDTFETDEYKLKSIPKKDYLEYLSIGVGIKKKSGGRKNSPIKTLRASMAQRVERLEQLSTVGIGMSFTNSRFSKRRKDTRSIDSPVEGSPSSTLNPWGRRDSQQQKPNYTRRESCDKSWDSHPYISTASQEVAKLKRLEKSYAEVLRLGPQKASRSNSVVGNHYRK